MADYSVTLTKDVEIDVKNVIDNNMTIEDTKNIISDVFDGLNVEDKPQLVGVLFSSLTEQGQNEVLDDIISEQLSDEQFHTLTEYFKEYGK